MRDDYLVTVCDACLRASCWHGDHPCAKYRSAGIVDKKASELLKMRRESATYFSRERLKSVYGYVEEQA